MNGFLYLVVSLGIIVAWTFVLCANRSLVDTTLKSAWIWSLLAATAWAVTWVVDQCLMAISPALADHAWYANAVLALCPPMAVLGSRRPGTRVWAWFILFPMVLALGWPVGTLWLQGSELRGLHLETPQLAAFCLVLVMGVGNYCGTRFTICALLYGVSTLALVVSSSAVSPDWLSDRSATRFWCTALMVLAVCLTRTSTRPPAATKFDRLWFEFFDTFGIVWGRRIQDRINFIAKQESLPVRLELDGFVWIKPAQVDGTSIPDDSANTLARRASEGSSAAALDAPIPKSVQSDHQQLQLPITNEVELRIEHIFRWLLRRFVDPAWIDRHLESKSAQKVDGLSVDS